MARRRPMAGLTAHVDLSPASSKRIGLWIVAFAQAGGVAVGTHVVPVLRRPGPVKLIPMAHRIIWVQVEPALPAFVGRAAIPSNRQGLQTTDGKFHQVLLQWINAEGVTDLELV